MIIDIVKVIFPAVLTFIIGIGITPFITNFLYKNKMWKTSAKTVAVDGHGTPLFNELHKDRETKTPRMGGIVIWASAGAAIMGIWFLSKVIPTELFLKMDFLSRDQTWIPFTALIVGALVGLVDDILEIRGSRDHAAGGLSLKKRLLVVILLGGFVGYWFYSKLDVSSIGIPFGGELQIGWLIIPAYIAILLSLYAGGVIDGIDGLSGGIFATMFAAYAGIAFYLGSINLAAFSASIVGGILAFLWFNIPPARFYMTETGTMALTLTLGVVAFMTDSLVEGKGILVLPIIAFPLVATVLSDIIQVLSKKLRNGKKVFKIAPLHHHFEALGWPPYKVVMRYWIISVIVAGVGVIIALIG